MAYLCERNGGDGRQIVGGKPGRFRSALAAQSVQRVAPCRQDAGEIPGFDDEPLAVDLGAGRDRAAGEVQVQGPHHVDPGVVFKHPEL